MSFKEESLLYFNSFSFILIEIKMMYQKTKIILQSTSLLNLSTYILFLCFSKKMDEKTM